MREKTREQDSSEITNLCLAVTVHQEQVLQVGNNYETICESSRAVERRKREEPCHVVSIWWYVFTLWIQCLQLGRAADGLHHPRLLYYTLHIPTLLPLLGAQSVIASGSVGPIWVLLSGGGLRECGAILNPGHRHFLWVETLQITVKRERNVSGVRWHNRKPHRREI